MCKHVAAALYGVGARLDEQPQLLFLLRGVDQNDLIASAGAGMAAPRRGAVSKAKVLAGDDMAALFGLDMAEAGGLPAPTGKTSGPRAIAKSSPPKSTRKTVAPKASAARSPTPGKKSLARSHA